MSSQALARTRTPSLSVNHAAPTAQPPPQRPMFQSARGASASSLPLSRPGPARRRGGGATAPTVSGARGSARARPGAGPCRARRAHASAPWRRPPLFSSAVAASEARPAAEAPSARAALAPPPPPGRCSPGRGSSLGAGRRSLPGLPSRRDGSPCPRCSDPPASLRRRAAAAGSSAAAPGPACAGRCRAAPPVHHRHRRRPRRGPGPGAATAHRRASGLDPGAPRLRRRP
mmetsp:Transcript_136468/g.435793  ORF Transcript_136468/g.435793 Transcript_136468/m.435793 type:complete len:230 (-) Transcript_136468:1928-2617(-)